MLTSIAVDFEWTIVKKRKTSHIPLTLTPSMKEKKSKKNRKEKHCGYVFIHIFFSLLLLLLLHVNSHVKVIFQSYFFLHISQFSVSFLLLWLCSWFGGAPLIPLIYAHDMWTQWHLTHYCRAFFFSSSSFLLGVARSYWPVCMYVCVTRTNQITIHTIESVDWNRAE